jgi:hypothetical protein
MREERSERQNLCALDNNKRIANDERAERSGSSTRPNVPYRLERDRETRSTGVSREPWPFRDFRWQSQDQNVASFLEWERTRKKFARDNFQ